MEFLRSLYLSLPQKPGVYQFLSREGNVLYVGKAKNLKNRVSSYFSKNAVLYLKTQALVEKVEKIKITVVESEIESLLLEANVIKKYKPPYNIRLTDGKSYPIIQITKKEKYPKILITRKIPDNSQNDGSIYFGPYPNAGALKLVLKTIRRIFSFESNRNHLKKTCLYYHLRLCPCAEAFDTKEVQEEYKRNIRHIIQFLNGNIGTVLKELEKERDEKSNQEEFEKAKNIQNQIQAIHLITEAVHTPFEYEVNPNLTIDLRQKELEELTIHLSKAGVFASHLLRIECFDMSNIAGYFAVGSMVVFINGEKNTSLYRRFKIKRQPVGMPNDFIMMQEVIERRLRNTQWPYPDLLIVDGGKGQVTSALMALKKYNIQLPVIGLAKREETIITSDFKEIKLPKSSKALQLLQRIRDEAHRFAITYHRKLRKKQSFL